MATVQEFTLSDTLWKQLAPSRLAFDGSLYKAPLGGEINSPLTDRAKGGVKYSRLTEARGIPVGLVLDGASRNDVKLVDSTLASLPPIAEAARDVHRAAGGEQGLCRDAGYDAIQVRETLTALGETAYIRPRGEEVKAKKAGQRARHWVVERTHYWLSRFRYLLIRWDKNSENYSAMLHFACARITWYNCLFG